MTASILFADAPDGTRLPVIDITNQAFAVQESEAEVAALATRALAVERGRGPLQRLLLRPLIWAMARGSRLLRALRAADSGYMAGVPTYVMKLGPSNTVPPYDTPLDKAVLASGPVSSLRIRLFGMARLLAEGLTPALVSERVAPLCLLDIAGGPSSDSLNALILLAAQGLLAGRSVTVCIYDIDADGPAFGSEMLKALRTGPLAGVDVRMDHVPGNWSDLDALGRTAAGLANGAIVAAASEGGLFEYGSDREITDALETLAPYVPLVVGSVTRDDELNRMIRRAGRAATTPRGLDRFSQLISPTGYRIANSRPSPLSDQVLLIKS